jgi:hypothetical protein
MILVGCRDLAFSLASACTRHGEGSFERLSSDVCSQVEIWYSRSVSAWESSGSKYSWAIYVMRETTAIGIHDPNSLVYLRLYCS